LKRLISLCLSLSLAGLAGCGSSSNEFVATTATGATTDQILRSALDQQGVFAIQAPVTDPAKVALGRNLFFDKLLSGNRDIACATCHHPLTHTGDNLSVSIGTGGVGLGTARQLGINQQTLQPNSFIPRNAPEVFNRGDQEWTTMFWDMRVSGTAALGFSTPAGAALPAGITSVLAAQAMFPVTSRDEMRGNSGDLDVNMAPNEIAVIADNDLPAMWAALMTRILGIAEYQNQFAAAFPNVPQNQLGFEHAADAIAEFEIEFWTGTDSPFDRYINGDNDALTASQKRGALLFYGQANCYQCHTGTLMTDQQAHSIGAPQIGPGRGTAAPLDHGRGAETGDATENFQFRTPPLRNVALTGPWLHDGAYTTLEGVVRQHLNPSQALNNYDVNQLQPVFRPTFQGDANSISQILASVDPILQTPVDLSDGEVADLVNFLQALTDPKFLDQSLEVPENVPSGLPVAD
jgi:cytochrome c peroxidase